MKPLITLVVWHQIQYSRHQGRAETFGGAGAQSIKGAHGARLLIGLCCLLICASKWMLLYWYNSKCHDAVLFFLHLLITLEWYYYYYYYYYCCCCCVFTGYGGFAVVNTTVVVVEKNILVLFKIEFYSNPVLNLFIFWMIMIIKTGLNSIIRRKISISPVLW